MPNAARGTAQQKTRRNHAKLKLRCIWAPDQHGLRYRPESPRRLKQYVSALVQGVRFSGASRVACAAKRRTFRRPRAVALRLVGPERTGRCGTSTARKGN